MPVYICHHHLYPGGVSRIIASQVKSSLMNNLDVVVLSGDQSSLPIDGEVRVHDDFNYLDRNLSLDVKKEIHSRLRDTLLSYCKNDPTTLFHVHNLNLGKNPILTLVFSELVKEGKCRLINHCHDFPEDDRPANMEFLKEILIDDFSNGFDETMYYQTPANAYIVINQKDKKRLLSKGIDENKILYLPNAIDPPEPKKGIDESKVRQKLGLKNDKPLFVYPVRVIGRKNIGEFILLSALFKDKGNWVVTQAPKNPTELDPYLEWKKFCEENEISITFEAGERVDFDDLMNISSRMITTSRGEGFGMVFLEPWLYGHPVCGRDLPEVTQDFKTKGLKYEHLYQQLSIENQQGESSDFKDFSDNDQQISILKCLSNSSYARSIINKNNLETLFKPCSENLIQHNSEVIRSQFSTRAYGQHLKNFYETVF